MAIGLENLEALTCPRPYLGLLSGRLSALKMKSTERERALIAVYKLWNDIKIKCRRGKGR